MRFNIAALLVLLLFAPVFFPSAPAFSQDNIPTPETFNWIAAWQWIAAIVAVSGVLSGLTLFWNRRLAKEVNERKQAEAALVSARDELEYRVEERAAELAKANALLQESETSYRELADSITDVFFAMDANLRYTYWNKASENLTGIASQEALGKSLDDLFPDTPETLRAEEVYRNVLQTQQPRSFVTEYRLNDRTFLFEISVYPSRHGISVFTRDITERKQTEEALRESEQRYRELFENMNSGVAVYEVRGDGEDFVFKDFNKAAERIDGDRRKDLIGRSLFEARPGVEVFGLIEVFRHVWKTGEPMHHPVTLYQDNTLSGWYENFVYKLPSGEIVAVFDNLTEKKQAEEELRKYREHLEELVKERTAELETRTRELETFNKAMVDREMRIIEMKEEINRLCAELGDEPKYPPVWK